MDLVVWLVIAAVYSPVFLQLYQSRWEQIDYTHAYFILPVSLWIVWQKRGSLSRLIRETAPSGGWAGLLVLTCGLLMFMLGWRWDYLFVSTLSFLPVVWGAARFLYGRAASRELRFPLLFLLFMVPPPLGVLDALTLPMRYGVSQVTESILGFLGYPIERSGLMLMMGGNEIFMGAPCSGFRSLITMFALAVAYVYFIRGDRLKKTILLPSVLPFALLGNVIRVIGLCLVTYYAGQEAAEGFFHYGSGAVIFLVMIACLMGLEFIIERMQRLREGGTV